MARSSSALILALALGAASAFTPMKALQARSRAAVVRAEEAEAEAEAPAEAPAAAPAAAAAAPTSNSYAAPKGSNFDTKYGFSYGACILITVVMRVV
jgi:hypothetical protein